MADCPDFSHLLITIARKTPLHGILSPLQKEVRE